METLNRLLRAASDEPLGVAVCSALLDALTEAGAPSSVIASVAVNLRYRLDGRWLPSLMYSDQWRILDLWMREQMKGQPS